MTGLLCVAAPETRGQHIRDHGADAGEAPALEAALVKDLGTRFEKEVVEVARLAVSPDSAGPAFKARLAEAILHSPGFTLRGGTNEIPASRARNASARPSSARYRNRSIPSRAAASPRSRLRGDRPNTHTS